MAPCGIDRGPSRPRPTATVDVGDRMRPDPVASPHDSTPATSAAAPGAGSRAGLSSAEVERRRRTGGRNVLPQPPRRSALRQLLAQWTHFFAGLLWVATVLALVAGMPQLAVAIAVVVVVNGVFAFVQEHRAERAADRLHDLLPRRARVRRDGGELEVDAAELVAGDLVVLTAGDRICADLCIDEAVGLAVDVSTMTGESVPERCGAGGRLLAGTFVVEGEALAKVTAIGAGTELASIAALTQGGGRRITPLTRELDRLVRVVAAMAVGIGVCFVGISLLVGMPLGDGFLFGVGVMVALVPEGLLPTVTLSFVDHFESIDDRRRRYATPGVPSPTS